MSITSSKIYHVRSKDANQYYNGLTSDFEIVLEEPIVGQMDEILYCSIDNLQIPFSFYSVNAFNNRFPFFDYDISQPNPYPISFKLENGNYSITQVIQILKQKMNTLSHYQYTYEILYSRITNKVSFQVGLKNGNVVKAIIDFTDPYDLQDVLGFSSPTVELMSNIPKTSEKACNMNSVDAIYIRSNISSSNSFSSSTKGICDILCKVPINAQPYGIISYKNETGTKIRLNSQVLDRVHLRLTDMDGDVIDLNGLQWAISLHIMFEKKVEIDYGPDEIPVMISGE